MSTPIQHVKTLIKAGRVPMLEGAPGCGKTQFLQALAEELGMKFVPIVMSVAEPIDVMGLPTVENGKARFLPFGHFEELFNCTEPTLCLLDDLGQAGPAVQAAIMQVIHGGRINGHTIDPELVKFAIATNRPKDKAGVHPIISPIREGRAVTLPWSLECDCNKDRVCQWHQWTSTADLYPAVPAFVRFRPHCLTEFDDTDSRNTMVAHCNARALEVLSDCEKEGIYDPALTLIEGIIGPKYATEYLAFRTMYRSMTHLDEYLTKPETAPLPTQMDQQIAISTALAYSIEPQHAEAFCKFIKRLAPEIGAAALFSAKARIPSIMNYATDWAIANSSTFINAA